MDITDYLVIAAFLICGIVGAMRGLLREAVALLTWIIALLVAWHFAALIAPHLGGLLAGPTVRPWAARAMLALLILLLGSGVGAVLTQFVRLSVFSGVDRLLGFVFGFLRTAVLFGVFVIVAQLLQLDGERWWRQSLLMPYGESVANGLRVLVGEPSVAHRRSLGALTKHAVAPAES